MKQYQNFAPPPQVGLPIIQKLVSAYKLWHEFLLHFPKTTRYTLGSKIDSQFVELIELLFKASIAQRQQKLPFLQRASITLDLLKFFLQISWELKSLDAKKYVALSEHLYETGKMLGGWNRQLIKENPA